eukprot:448-Eustigmatos_ZCMA.PRE.1
MAASAWALPTGFWLISHRPGLVVWAAAAKGRTRSAAATWCIQGDMAGSFVRVEWCILRPGVRAA